jgi:hypothetical protein
MLFRVGPASGHIAGRTAVAADGRPDPAISSLAMHAALCIPGQGNDFHDFEADVTFER